MRQKTIKKVKRFLRENWDALELGKMNLAILRRYTRKVMNKELLVQSQPKPELVLPQMDSRIMETILRNESVSMRKRKARFARKLENAAAASSHREHRLSEQGRTPGPDGH